MAAVHSLPRTNTFISVNTAYAAIERSLDVAGYIPVVNQVSSAVRAGLALVQVVHGVSLSILTTFAHIHNLTSETPANRSIRSMATLSRDLIKNGAFNGVRAAYEASGAVGGLVCFIFDAFKANFSPTRLRNFYGNYVKNIEIHRPIIAQALIAG